MAKVFVTSLVSRATTGLVFQPWLDKYENLSFSGIPIEYLPRPTMVLFFVTLNIPP